MTARLHNPPLRLWHLTSLDAPTVAVVWSQALARAAAVRLPLWVPVLLALGTWTVYAADRLLDARAAHAAGNLSALRERHLFHWRHRRVFVAAASLAALAAAALIFTRMPAALRERNSVLGAAALLYFSGVHAPRRLGLRVLSKEFLVGLLFTLGCALPTFTRTAAAALPWAFDAGIAFFAALAWMNCRAIDRWESGRSAGRAPLLLGCAGLALAIGCARTHPSCAALLATGAAAALLLGLLNRMRHRFAPTTLRAAADLVLLAPLAMLVR